MELRTFHAKQPHYRTDGFGRDTYIVQNNGGLSTRLQKQANGKTVTLSPHSPVMRIPNIRIPNYYSNGTGRDSYITSTGGGFYTSKHGADSFTRSLRESPERRMIHETDYFAHANTTWVYPKNRHLMRERASRQSDTITRLASPKRQVGTTKPFLRRRLSSEL